MSNGKGRGKGKGQSQNLDFHYFSLTATQNPDGSVILQIDQINPFPDGFILKDFDIIKKDTSGNYLGSPWGLGPNQSVDVRTFEGWNNGNFTDTYQNQPGDPSITYNMTGSAGFPNVISSGDSVGSAVVTVTF